MSYNIVSLFAGAGGLDTGFTNAGFKIIWANEYDKNIWATYQINHPSTHMDTRDICSVPSSDLPDCDGIIGGPPCQSWSAAGNNRGLNDKRGSVFLEYLRILRDKQPKFFVIENVEGLTRQTHSIVLKRFIAELTDCGYKLYYELLNSADYDVPQDRKRIFFVGIRADLPVTYLFPAKSSHSPKLRDAIYDLRHRAVPSD